MNGGRDRLPEYSAALKIALAYAAFAGLWILLSDRAVEALFADREQMMRVSILKGWLFVAVTAALLYAMVWRAQARLAAAARREVELQIERLSTLGLLESIAEGSDDAIFAKDRDGRYLLFNAAAARFVGQPVAAVLGRDDRSLFPAAQAEMLMAFDRDLMARGCIDRQEERLDTADGQRVFQVVKGPLRSPDGQIVGVFGISHDITAARRTEAELRTSKARLEAALSAMEDAVFISDTDGGFLEFNDAFAGFHRFANKEECRRSLAEYPEILDVFLADGQLAPLDQWAVSRALRGERGSGVEYGLRRKDTGESWIGSYSFAPIRDAGGRIVGSVVVGRDVTQIKMAELALRESERRFLDIAKASADWLWEVDAQARYTYASAGVTDVLGYTPEEVIGRTPFDLMPPAEAKRVGAEFAGIAARREMFRDLDNINVSKDGRLVDISTNGVPMLDAAGNLLGYRGLDRDVTERKRAEQTLREAEERWPLAIDGAGHGLWDWNAATDKVFYSPSWKSMLGYADDEIGDGLEEWSNRVHPDDLPRCMADLERHFRGETKRYSNEHRIHCKDGSYKWVLDQGSVVGRDAAGRPLRVIGTHTDIGARKAAEEELRSRNEELERFNRAGVDRELAMVELKRQVNALSRELGREPPYPLQFVDKEGSA